MTVGVIGTGAMGSGIAQVAAMAGCEVRIFDSNAESISNALVNISQSVQKFVQKGKLTPELGVAIHGAILPCTKLSSFHDCDIIIEAIVEDIDVKKKLFKELENVASTSCILASNTSSLSITAIASSIEHNDRCIGVHFFNPPVMMKLVEIIPAIQTSSETIEKTKDIINAWGKTIAMAKDTPGFIVNKVARPYYSEAIRIYEEGIASKEEIDQAMLACGFKMGPFTLMDFIGHDVNYKVTESVWKAFYYDSRYRPSVSQCRLLEAGFLGRKSGRGFYRYDDGIDIVQSFTAIANKSISNRILAMLINEGADTVVFGIASPEDIDCAVLNGLNYPKGLFELAKEIGHKKVVKILDSLYDQYREERYKTSPLLRKMVKSNEA
jgi:3-hydroxybutyryl-CoA dehydrogenase